MNHCLTHSLIHLLLLDYLFTALFTHALACYSTCSITPLPSVFTHSLTHSLTILQVKLNKQLPYLVANIVEIVEPYVDIEEDGSAGDSNADYKGKGVVVKTSTRQTVFLPIPGLVRAEEVVPGELVGVNKDSYIVLEKLPAEFDSRTKAMEVDDRPTEDYTDIGGLDKQIQELIEAVVLPMTQAEKFEAIGIRAPKGVLLYGPPGEYMTLTE